MQLTGHGVTLRSLESDDLPMVLQWRNSEHIRRHMKNQETITLEDHQQWFQNHNKSDDLYFIIEIGDRPVGLIWAKDIHDNSCETGFYLYDESVQNTMLAYRVSLSFNDYIFDEKQLELIYCDILHENERSIRFTLSLGYKEVSTYPEYAHFHLNKSLYLPRRKRIANLLQKSSR